MSYCVFCQSWEKDEDCNKDLIESFIDVNNDLEVCVSIYINEDSNDLVFNMDSVPDGRNIKKKKKKIKFCPMCGRKLSNNKETISEE